MLKAGALLYAIVISFLIALISSFFVLNAYFQNRIIENQIQYEQLVSNVNASFSWFLADSQIIDCKQEKQLNVFDEVSSTVKMKYKPWGLYSFVSSSAIWKHLSFKKQALIGDDIQANTEKSIALYLADHNNQLSLGGNSHIKGKVYLPKLGVKIAYIEGKSFLGNQLIEGDIAVSEKQLSSINESVLVNNINYLNGEYAEQDSIVNYEVFVEKDSIVNSFSNKTVVVEIPNDISIRNKFLRGNIILISKGRIEIANNNKLNNIIIYAKDILVEGGLKSQVQLISNHKINIQSGVKLYYPSTVCLIKDNDILDSGIILEEESLVQGTVLLLNRRKQTDKQSIIKINKESRIHGQVYSNDLLEHQGIVWGSVYASQLILRTPSSVYENHLLDATIDYTQLSPYFVGVDFFEDKRYSKKKIIQWLN